MKKFRTIFLPLFLCSVILLSGYLSPVLFDKLTPDPRNIAEPISISTVGNPMHLESAVEVILPPWDDISTNQAEHLLEAFAISEDEQAALSEQIEADIEALFPDITNIGVLQDHDWTDVLLFRENYYFLVLQDHSCTFRLDGSVDDAPYMVDYVLDSFNTFPIYLHLQGEKTLPVADESKLRDNLEQLISKLRRDFWQDPIDSLNSMYMGKYVSPLTGVFMELFLHDDFSKTVWLSILLHCEDIYTLTYKNETLLVMVDEENLISYLFFDALTNRVTGYSIDPRLVSLSMDSTRISP